MIEWYYEKLDELLESAECFIDKAIVVSNDHPKVSEDLIAVAEVQLKMAHDVLMKHIKHCNEEHSHDDHSDHKGHESVAQKYIESRAHSKYYKLKSVISNMKL